jgi:hypothetical protein
VASSSIVSDPPRDSLRADTCRGRKSATAAAISRASARPSTTTPMTASRIAAVLSARTIVASVGSGTSTRPATIVTRAPRAIAASAIATPILPLLRLPMYLTGSIASAVPPALTTRWRPSRSGSRTGATRAGRTAGSGARTGRPAIIATTASTISDGSASRPTPDWPDASDPISGGTSR